MATIYESTVTVVSATGVACPGLLGRPGVGCTRRCVSRPTAAGGSWAEMGFLHLWGWPPARFGDFRAVESYAGLGEASPGPIIKQKA